jgi:hypothetical protein
MTPGSRIGSVLFSGIVLCVISPACGRGRADPAPTRTSQPAASARAETCLGVTDKGIWSDLDDQVQLPLPRVEAGRVTAIRDAKHALLIVEIDGFPRKAYPLALRPGDRAELAGLAPAATLDAVAGHDADGDGIPDPLDVLVGAKKTVLNADAYTEGYVEMPYPMGDVPRTMGVCTDVIVRAVRNAGIDLQQALHDDIRRAPKAYPMIKGRGNPSIDQRRVGTLLPYFKRHWEAHSAQLDDPEDPLRPGDVIFMDTFPSRSGPDHIGILSDRTDERGLPLVINNWTNGTTTSEMDLLTFVPVMYRFRLPP